MFNKKVVRIIAIIMAALMLLGVFGIAITTFAAGGDYPLNYIPATGQDENVSLIPIVIAIISLVAIAACLVSVIIGVVFSKKKKDNSSPEDDYIKVEQVEESLNFFTSKKEDTFMEKQNKD